MAGNDNGLRVLMLISQFHPRIGGAEKQALALAGKLVAMGHEVDILTLRERGIPKEEIIDGVRVLRRLMVWPRPFFWGLLYLLSSFMFLIRHGRRYDLYHGHQFQGFHNTAAVLIGRLYSRPVIIKIASSGEGSDLLRLVAYRCGRLLKNIHGRADRIVCTTDVMRRQALGLGLDEGRLMIIPNGVEGTGAIPVSLFEERFSLPSKAAVLGAVSRLQPKKGIHILLEAFSDVSAKRSDTRLVIIGDGPERRRLEDQARNGLPVDRVHFAGWIDEASSWMPLFRLLVFPSLVEGFPNVLLEAMAAGVPVVASDIPPHREILDEGKFGRLAPAGDPRGLAWVILKALKDPEGSRRLAEDAKRQVLENYSLDGVADQYIKLYGALAEKKGRSSVSFRS